MKTLVFVICLTFSVGSFATITPITNETDCVVDTLPKEPGTCQLHQDEKGTKWLVFKDDSKMIRFIRTVINNRYVYLYQRKRFNSA